MGDKSTEKAFARLQHACRNIGRCRNFGTKIFGTKAGRRRPKFMRRRTASGALAKPLPIDVQEDLLLTGTRDSQLLHLGLECGALHVQSSRSAVGPSEHPIRFAQHLENMLPFKVGELADLAISIVG